MQYSIGNMLEMFLEPAYLNSDDSPRRKTKRRQQDEKDFN